MLDQRADRRHRDRRRVPRAVGVGVERARTASRRRRSQLRDGEASKQTFEASDTDHFVPGKKIEIRLGYRGETNRCSRGSSSSTGCRIRKNGTMLVVECRDKAVRMTRGLNSRYFTDTTDSDILDDLIGAYGLERDVQRPRPR